MLSLSMPKKLHVTLLYFATCCSINVISLIFLFGVSLHSYLGSRSLCLICVAFLDVSCSLSGRCIIFKPNHQICHVGTSTSREIRKRCDASFPFRMTSLLNSGHINQKCTKCVSTAAACSINDNIFAAETQRKGKQLELMCTRTSSSLSTNSQLQSSEERMKKT